MVDKEKESLRSALNNAQRKEVHQRVVNRIRVNAGVVIDEMELRAKIGDSSWLLEPVEPADVLFDFGPYDKPNVAITYPWENRPAVIFTTI